MACSAALGVGIVGVGIAGVAAAAQSAKQVLNNSWGLAEKTSSVTISGSGTSSSQTFSLDVTVASNGNAKGWIATQGNKLYLVKIGSEGYFKADGAFFRAEGGTGGTAAAALFANKWLKASGSNSPLSGFSEFFGIRSFFAANKPSQLSHLTVKDVTFHGHAAYQVRGSQDGQAGTVVISASSPEYPLEITAPGNGTLYFSNWGHHVTIHAPHGAIDFNSLSG